MIEAEFGVSYSLAHVRNILIAMVGSDHWPLSSVRFWARVIALAYPEWVGRVFVEDFDEGWILNWKIVGELRRRLGRDVWPLAAALRASATSVVG